MYFNNLEEVKNFLKSEIKINPKTGRKISNNGKIYKNIMKTIENDWNEIFQESIDKNINPKILEKKTFAKPIMNIKFLENALVINNKDPKLYILSDKNEVYKGPYDLKQKKLLKFRKYIIDQYLTNVLSYDVLKDNNNQYWLKMENIYKGFELKFIEPNNNITMREYGFIKATEFKNDRLMLKKILFEQDVLFQLLILNIIGVGDLGFHNIIIQGCHEIVKNIKSIILDIDDENHKNIKKVTDLFDNEDDIIKEVIEENIKTEEVKVKLDYLKNLIINISKKYSINLNIEERFENIIMLI
jgi:hypothetical protein